MTEQNDEHSEIRPESMHFQLMMAGTLAFLAVLFWLTDSIGIQVIGCYLAFAGIIFGHKLLSNRYDARSKH